ncbi:unnamed protein product [Urochloa humidicola]
MLKNRRLADAVELEAVGLWATEIRRRRVRLGDRQPLESGESSTAATEGGGVRPSSGWVLGCVELGGGYGDALDWWRRQYEGHRGGEEEQMEGFILIFIYFIAFLVSRVVMAPGLLAGVNGLGSNVFPFECRFYNSLHPGIYFIFIFYIF